VKVNNNVPYYDVIVFFPNQPHLNYAYRTENEGGRIYLDIPPAGYNATILIQAEGVATGSPLSFSAEKFNQLYPQSVERGYYISHDFKVSGPITEKSPIPKGTLSQKNSTPWLWLAAGGITTVAILIVVAAALLILILIKIIKKRKHH
jgi:hypothetical protein